MAAESERVTFGSGRQTAIGGWLHIHQKADSTGWAHGLITRRHEMGREMCYGRESEGGCTGGEYNQEALYTCVGFSKVKMKKRN